MGMTMRVSLPGYDALTDGTIDHYSIYADSDNILIKEKTRGTININNIASGTISHSLGYVPYYLVFMKSGNYFYRINGGDLLDNNIITFVGTTNLVIRNFSGGTKTFYYHIFHDNGTIAL